MAPLNSNNNIHIMSYVDKSRYIDQPTPKKPD